MQSSSALSVVSGHLSRMSIVPYRTELQQSSLPATTALAIDLAVSSEIHLRICRSALRWKWIALHMFVEGQHVVDSHS